MAEPCKECGQDSDRIKQLEFTFDLRWKADMRAIALWREKTGKELSWPDHADLVVWLLEQLEQKQS
jgi:hypothetical protein